MTQPSTGESATRAPSAIRSWAAWLLLAVTALILFSWVLYWLLPLTTDSPRRPPTLLDSAGTFLIAAPLFAVFLTSVLRPALPSAPVIEHIALFCYGVAAAGHTGFLIHGLRGGGWFGYSYLAALEEITAAVVQILFLGLVIVAGAFVVSARRTRRSHTSA